MLQKEQKNKTPVSFMGEEVEKLDDHGCFQLHDLVDEEVWSCSSYPFRRKTTLHCAEREAKMFGN